MVLTHFWIKVRWILRTWNWQSFWIKVPLNVLEKPVNQYPTHFLISPFDKYFFIYVFLFCFFTSTELSFLRTLLESLVLDFNGLEKICLIKITERTNYTRYTLPFFNSFLSHVLRLFCSLPLNRFVWMLGELHLRFVWTIRCFPVCIGFWVMKIVLRFVEQLA